MAGSIVFVLLFVIVALAMMTRRGRQSGRRRGFGVGPGATGAIYDLLNEDKRNAIEIIVEEKAAARDPETADGNLPDLARTSSERRSPH